MPTFPRSGVLTWRWPAWLRKSFFHGPAGRLLFLLLLAGAGCRSSATRQVSDPAPAVARLQAGGSLQTEADRLVLPLLTNGELYGLVVGVVTPDGATRCFGYGRTGRPDDLSPPDGDSLFQIGSLTKLFAEAAYVRLLQTGQIRDDDTVREILPTNVPVTLEAGRMTLHDLARHTAGLQREPFTSGQLESFLVYLATGRNLYAHLTIPYLLDYLNYYRPRPKEPREYVYSNFGAALLMYLIGQQAGEPAENLIVENICRPLGLTNTVFGLDARQRERLTVGHVGNQACWKPANWSLAPWDMGELMSPISGLYSSANDLMIFAQANLGLLPTPLAPALNATHQVQMQSARDGEALGWIVTRYDHDRRIITFKDGVMSGYHSFIGLDLDTRVAVVMLANKFDWNEKVGLNLLLRVSGAVANGRTPVSTTLRSVAAPGR